jgi:hypothetical protein
VYVTKYDGSTQEYDSSKLYRTIIRHGVSEEVAEAILSEIEKNLYDGIKTRDIMRLMEKNLRKYYKSDPLKRDLRTALGMVKPIPDFEEYVRRLLRAEGYEVQPNQEIQGYCVTHEIDGVATRNGETCYIETKHHSRTHTYTPFDVTLAAKGKYDDIKKGYNNGRNTFDFDRVIIVCNTRLTRHATQYAECVGIEHIGWKNPLNNGIDAIITRNNVYPVTILRSLSRNEYLKMSSMGIVTLNDLIDTDLRLFNTEREKELKDLAIKIVEQNPK